MGPITITPIGILHCDLQAFEHTPKSFRESDKIGIIEIFPEYTEGLYSIRTGDTIIVLFWFNKAKRDIFKVHPRGDKTKKKRGVFATRSPVRPNPIAVSELKVLEINENRLTVQGIDALDQTPILDIKMTLFK